MGLPIHVCTTLSLQFAKRCAIRKTQRWIRSGHVSSGWVCLQHVFRGTCHAVIRACPSAAYFRTFAPEPRPSLCRGGGGGTLGSCGLWAGVVLCTGAVRGGGFHSTLPRKRAPAFPGPGCGALSRAVHVNARHCTPERRTPGGLQVPGPREQDSESEVPGGSAACGRGRKAQAARGARPRRG